MSKFLDENGLSYFWSKIKATLKTVAFTGSYNDLTNKPNIPQGATVDTELNSSSTNPVQNKAIHSALATKVTSAQAIQAVSGAGYATSANASAIASSLISAGGYVTSTYVAGATVANAGHADTADFATTASTASYLGSDTIGASGKPVYISSGYPVSMAVVDSATNASSLGGLTSAGYVQTGNVNQTISGTKTFATNTNMAAIEFTGATTHGGFLDFHYGASTADYTARIIEQESGKLGIKGRMVISGAGTNPATQGLTITGTGNYALALQNTTIQKGTAPTAANNYIGIDFFGSANDSYNKRLGLIETNTTSTNQNTLQIVAYHTNSATATGGASIKLVTSNGSAWTETLTPATADSSTKIATTAFVKAQGYTTAAGHTHSYLPLSGGTVTGQLNCTYGTISCCATSAAAQVYVDNGMGHKIGLHTNTGNNAGIYDWTTNQWIIRANTSKQTWLNGYVTSKPAGESWVNAAKTDNALVNATTTTFGGILNAPTKNYRVALATYPGNDDWVYLYSVTNANISAGSNNRAKSLIWNASTGALNCDGGFAGTAANATTWGGYTNDITTDNTSDTWLLVAKNEAIQHRRMATLSVGTAASCTGNAATATNATSLGGKAASQYLTAHQSLANYVTLNGTQTITGAKTYSGQNITVSAGNIHTYINGGFYAHNASNTVWGSMQANGSNIFGLYFNTGSKWVVHVNSAGTATFSGSLAGSSDERLKGAIATIDGKVLDAWDKVDWRQFKYNSEVAEKGNNAPTHVGLVAQHVSNCLVENGVDANSLHIIGNDYLNTTEEDTPDEYVVYYVEALCMEAAYQRRRAERAEARITALEQRFNELGEVLVTSGDHSNAS